LKILNLKSSASTASTKAFAKSSSSPNRTPQFDAAHRFPVPKKRKPGAGLLHRARLSKI
jgi:hypothetical protein